MSIRYWVGTALSLAILSTPVGVWASNRPGDPDRRTLPELVTDLAAVAQDSRSADESSPEEASLVRSLRHRGQAAVDALLAFRATWTAPNGEPKDAPAVQRLDDLIDQVAGQKHAKESRLFWHTSMKQAQKQAVKTGRPILSLRLLGRLDQDFSCANSRFFRTTLYPEPSIAKQLRDQFVLHWSPVRDVPKVTIDLGDGRKLKRPLTGNSVHLVLDSDGRPIDAMPGLVSHVEFLKWLRAASEFSTRLQGADPEQAVAMVAHYHRTRADQARQRSTLTIKRDQSVAQLDPSDRRWSDAAGEFADSALSAEARELVIKQLPAEIAMPLAVSKSFVETPLLRMVRKLNQNVARDTAFNLLGLKPKIDDWFAEVDQNSTLDYESLTNWIYAEVFLMPLTDPWLGLSPDDQFVALPNAGRVEAETTHSYQLKRLLSATKFSTD